MTDPKAKYPTKQEWNDALDTIVREVVKKSREEKRAGLMISHEEMGRRLSTDETEVVSED